MMYVNCHCFVYCQPEDASGQLDYRYDEFGFKVEEEGMWGYFMLIKKSKLKCIYRVQKIFSPITCPPGRLHRLIYLGRLHTVIYLPR